MAGARHHFSRRKVLGRERRLADAGGEGVPATTDSGSSGSVLYLLYQGFEDLLHDLTGGLLDFGGGPNLPPFYFMYQARLTRGGRHPHYNQIEEIQRDIALGQKTSVRAILSLPAQLSLFLGERPAIQLVQDIVPIEPAPPLQVPDTFDLDPESEPWGFAPRGVTYDRCLDAAQHPALWANLCRDMPNNIVAANCRSLMYKSLQERNGFCADLFET